MHVTETHSRGKGHLLVSDHGLDSPLESDEDDILPLLLRSLNIFWDLHNGFRQSYEVASDVVRMCRGVAGRDAANLAARPLAPPLHLSLM